MDEVVSLGRLRAERQEDCRAWSVKDCLREALRSVEAGEIDPDIVYVAFRQIDKTRDNWQSYPGICAGGNALEMRGLLAKHLAEQLRDDDE